MDLKSDVAYEISSSQSDNCDPSRSNQFSFCINRIKAFFEKKVQAIKEKSVYIETLSLQSIKRSMQRKFKVKCSPKSAGYVKFYTEEERQSVFYSLKIF